MDNTIKTLIDILVSLLLALPPFLYLHWYVRDKVNGIILRCLIYAVYWGSALFFSNLMPALTVVFVIWRSRKEHEYSEGGSETSLYRRFRLDCSGDRWRFSPGDFILNSLLGLLIYILVTYTNSIVISLLSYLNIPLKSQEVVNEFIKAGTAMSILYFVVIVFCAPVLEEFVFRFWLYDKILKHRIGAKLSIALSSLLFMILHFNIQGSVAILLIGIINCLLYEKKGYWAAVANHFMFNFISISMLIAAKAFNMPI